MNLEPKAELLFQKFLCHSVRVGPWSRKFVVPHENGPRLSEQDRLWINT